MTVTWDCRCRAVRVQKLAAVGGGCARLKQKECRQWSWRLAVTYQQAVAH